MIKHYPILCIFLLFSILSASQEIKKFEVQDFDLSGNVKSCQVITDYGQEIFEFDVLGRLIKATTRYNAEDRDITSYIFKNDDLVEKRVESFKDNEIDLSSSLAHFYSIDSVENKVIKEQIISYDKEFVEAQEYHYDSNNQLTRIIISHENAVDEVLIEHTKYEGEHTVTYFENGIIQKSVRESVKKGTKKEAVKVILTKNYLDGEPNMAEEVTIDENDLIISKQGFRYDTGEGGYVSFEKRFFEYNEEGILSKETIRLGNSAAVKEYIFQFDDNAQKNWVKKIITPDNSFVTRRITYYPKTIAKIEVPNK